MNAPKTPATPAPVPKPPGRLNWLWGTLAALVFAAGVGVGVYFILDARHRAAMDQAVEARVAEQMQASAQDPQGPPPATVKVAPVRMQVAQQRVPVVGRLEEVRRAVIASEVEGRVLELLTPAGREVVGGQTVIARVDGVWSGLAVEQAEADLAAARATARQSQRELEHLQDLAQRNAADPQTIDDAQAKAEADAANVLAYEAALHRAEETSKRVEIIAPFDGVVTRKLTEQGQWLDPGSDVVEIVSRGQIDAVINVPEQFITQVPVGTPVQVIIDALGKTIDGNVVAINPDGSNPARTFPVKVRIDDQGGLLKVGMSVTARVPINEQREYMVVPRNAVQYADNGPEVWMSVVMPGSPPDAMPVALPMPVAIVFGIDGLFAIEPKPKVQGMELRAGTPVVIEGAEQLFPTRPLIVLPSGDGPPADPQQAASAG